ASSLGRATARRGALSRGALESARRDDRRRSSGRQHARAPVLPVLEQSLLEQSVVRLLQQVRYHEMVQAFIEWARSAALPLSTVAELDHAVVSYRDLFFYGEVVDEASARLADLVFCDPRVTRRTPEPPRARRALDGSGKLAPSRARPPLPWKVVALQIVKMQALGHFDAAWLTLLNLLFYCRPSELLRARCRDLAAPPRWGPAALRKRSALLNPIEGGAPSKTAVFDESLLRDNAEFLWVSRVFEAIKARGSLDDLIVGLTYPQRRGHFQQAVNALPIDALRPAPLHQLRHGGADHEILGGGRDIAGVKKRGLWQSDSPLRLHVKAGRLDEQLQRQLDNRAQEAAAR
ncbi:unnamed protein product, partial [Prorocentrum cordatum]